MNRREAVSAVTLLLGGTVVGSGIFLSGCTSGNKKAIGLPLDKDAMTLLDEIAETIIPTTAGSQGAKAANLGAFMNVIVKDCYDEKDQKIFIEGIQKLQNAGKKKFSKSFMDCDTGQRKDLLVELDKEQTVYMKGKKEYDPSHYFRMMKELTLWGYFSSEIGATQALRYVAIPGKYESCIPYKKGDKAWAT